MIGRLLMLGLVLNALLQPDLAIAQSTRRCRDVLSDAEAAAATGFKDVKLLRETPRPPDRLMCGYSGGVTFTLEIASGPSAKTASDAYERAVSLGKGKVERVPGLGKRAWYDRSSALMWVDEGDTALSVVMGGSEGNPSVRRWLETIARSALTHL
jgi:hypothetical protein